MGRSRTLFARTGITLTVALLVFLLFSVAVVLHYILFPLGKLAADDLAALMVLSAQTWAELPPETRLDFERELLEKYQLRLSLPDGDLAFPKIPLPYLHFLEDALEERLRVRIPVRVSSEATTWFSADIPMAGRVLRIGFPRERIAPRPPAASLLVVVAGAVIILLTSLLLVRRLTDPLARLSEAALRLGRGETLQPLPETGARELATLTHSFNRMAAELSELLANRTILFAGISHDLRTPLTRMQLALEMLPDDTDPALLGRLRQDLEAMNRLIGDTLELARGLRTREAEDVDLREFVDGIISDYGHDDTRIDWSPGRCCIAPVDTLSLRRVLTNLIDNAVRYGGDRPVEVRCDCNLETAAIRILDRGEGIPQAEREAVFRPFHRLETSRSPSTGGSGLGLAIARQLCDAHGWHLRLQPRAGGGTEARLEIRLENSIQKTGMRS